MCRPLWPKAKALVEQCTAVHMGQSKTAFPKRKRCLFHPLCLAGPQLEANCPELLLEFPSTGDPNDFRTFGGWWHDTG